MRIVFYRRNFWGPASGGDQQIVTYARHLRAAGHEPSVLVKYPYAQGDDYFRRLRQAGVPVDCLMSHPVAGVARTVRRLVQRVRRRPVEPAWEEEQVAAWACKWRMRWGRPDVLHVVDLWENLEPIRLAHAAGVPVLYQDIRAPRDTPEKLAHAEGYADLLHSWYDPLLDQWYQRLAELLPLCAGVATLSPRLARLFRERVGYAGPMTIAPLIVEGPPEEHLPVRDPARPVTFGFAGRLERLKGPQVLLAAWDRIRKDFPGACVKVAGTGYHEQDIFAQAEELGLAESCQFVGSYEGQEGKTAFMNSIDAYVLPSFTEGTPNGIIEAMAHGLPVVSTHTGGIPDVVTTDTGVLVPPGSVDALAEALRRLAADGDLRRAMGRAARRRYEELFAPGSVLPVLIATYQGLARRRPGAADPANGRHPAHLWTRAEV